MCLAELTILLCFHSFRMSFLILHHSIITLFAFSTFQCYSSTHNFHLALCIIYEKLGIKKRPTSISLNIVSRHGPKSKCQLGTHFFSIGDGVLFKKTPSPMIICLAVLDKSLQILDISYCIFQLALDLVLLYPQLESSYPSLLPRYCIRRSLLQLKSRRQGLALLR